MRRGDLNSSEIIIGLKKSGKKCFLYRGCTLLRASNVAVWKPLTRRFEDWR